MTNAVQAEPVRLAYLTTHYPGLTHTFIQREVLSLRRLGHEILTFSINTESDVVSDVDRAELATTRSLKGRPKLWMIRTIAAAVLTNPRAVGATLLTASRGAGLDLGRHLRRAAQVGEALLLERMCREGGVGHIHVHFGQAPANIAWFTTTYFNRTNPGRTMTWSATVHGPQDCLNEPPLLLQRKFDAASCIIAVSDFTRSQLLWRLPPALWERIHVVRCGIDLAKPPHAINRRPDSPFRALIVARLSAEKGHGVAFEAVAALRKRGHDITLTLVGPGDYQAEYGDVVEQLGLRERVTNLGSLSPAGVAEQMAQADVLIVPSFAEGLPVVIMEAMAAGLPVIASGIAGIPELVEDDVAGLLVPPARPDLLAEAIEKVKTSPELARSFAAAGRRRVEEMHNENRNAHCLAEHLERATRQ